MGWLKYAPAPGLAILLSCAPFNARPHPSVHRGHAVVIGSFSDDYGIGYQISDTLWQLGNRDRYHIAAWNDSAGYLVAQNDPGNVADGGKWTRIDWLLLDGMPPYEWAFCLTEYKADTKAQAEANRTADRPNPRKGCNGFPFSRMRRVPADSAFTKVYQ